MTINPAIYTGILSRWREITGRVRPTEDEIAVLVHAVKLIERGCGVALVVMGGKLHVAGVPYDQSENRPWRDVA